MNLAHREPSTLALDALGLCQRCGDLYGLRITGKVWRHRRRSLDDRGRLIRRICPGSGLPPKGRRG